MKKTRYVLEWMFIVSLLSCSIQADEVPIYSDGVQGIQEFRAWPYATYTDIYVSAEVIQYPPMYYDEDVFIRGNNWPVTVSYRYTSYQDQGWGKHWRVGEGSEGAGWVDLQLNAPFLDDVDSAWVFWTGHATTSGGQNYTWLYLEINGHVLYDGDDFQPPDLWQGYYLPGALYYLQRSGNHIRIGCSTYSYTYYAIAQVGVVFWGPNPPVGVAEQTASDQFPTCVKLGQNHPNPFNAKTVIRYQLPVASHVKLEVFNLLGEKVATLVEDRQQAGYRSAVWDASEVSSGLYFYKLTAGDFTESRRMMLVK